jgi:transposase-like protein
VLERALGAELTQHLGYGKGENKPEVSCPTNSEHKFRPDKSERMAVLV